MKIEFQYTSKKMFWMLLVSFLVFILIAYGVLIVYGPIEAGARELDYFIALLFGVPVLVFFSGVRTYGKTGSMNLREKVVQINVHNVSYKFQYVDIVKITHSYYKGGFHLKIQTKQDKIVIRATYFAKIDQLEKAYYELEKRVETRKN